MSAFSRRIFIGTGLASAVLLGAAAWKGRQFIMSPPSKGGRIDTHHHFIPPVFVDAVGADRLASVTPNKIAPSWTVEKALQTCDTYGIGEAILSISPGYPLGDLAKERALMRACNDYAGDLRRDHPGKFGHFASIPMWDPAEALTEIAYALDTLKSDGIVVFTNYGGKYLGDSAFGEIWQELNRRKAVVFIHPTTPPYDLTGLPPEAIIEFPFDTTRAAVSLIYSGATIKYGDIKFILSHAGGSLPFLAGRVNGGARINPEIHDRVPDAAAEIKKFWFDLALSATPSSIAALLQVADPARVTFGSDFPYAPDIGIRFNVLGLDNAALSDATRADWNRGNAARLLGRAV